MFSRAWLFLRIFTHWLDVFLRLTLASYMFSVQLERFAIEYRKTKTKVVTFGLQERI